MHNEWNGMERNRIERNEFSNPYDSVMVFDNKLFQVKVNVILFISINYVRVWVVAIESNRIEYMHAHSLPYSNIHNDLSA